VCQLGVYHFPNNHVDPRNEQVHGLGWTELELVEQRLDARGGPKVLNVNAWNEWTEGSYLEPDTVHGMAYLEAIRDVFA